MKLLNGIGLGTFPFANPFTAVSEREALKIVHKYIELGGRYIDTAPTYSFGAVETLLSKVLAGIPRDKYYLNSSCGYVWDENQQISISGKYKDIMEDCRRSLQRLGVDELDLYISHIPDPNTPFEETVGAMLDLQEQGKVRSIGVSNVTLEQLKEYNRYGRIEYVQNRFSLINQGLDDEFVAYCREHEIGILAYQVIERGLLTEKAIKGIELREGDLRNRKSEFAVNVRQTVGRWVGQYLKPIASDLKTPISSLAIWWAMQQLAIALCISGATRVEHVDENLQALTLDPPQGTLERIDASYVALVEELRDSCSMTVREFTGLADYNIYSGSASGKS